MNLLMENFSSDPFLRARTVDSVIVLSARSGHMRAKGPFVNKTGNHDLTVALRPSFFNYSGQLCIQISHYNNLVDVMDIWKKAA